MTNQPPTINDPFHEIDYDASPLTDVGGFVPSSQKIMVPEQDEIRDLFTQMRDIARTHRSSHSYTRFFDRRVQSDNSVIFYQQGMFMKDFVDEYPESKPFSQYFPYYQMMGYEQLRTYFTWRTDVRQGYISDISLSYVFLYIYELLSNIGFDDPAVALDKLLSFWQGFRVHNKTIDKYIPQWLKDYHIYYILPHSWTIFALRHNLTPFFPDMTDTDDDFDLFCSLSKYDIKKSNFFTPKYALMIRDCFLFVLDRIRSDFEAAGISFDNALFRPTRKLVAWKPFKDALFHNPAPQPDRQVVLGKNEIYVCKDNEWKHSIHLTSEKGRQFISYVMRQMESTLREVMKYKFKLTAKTDMVNENTLRILSNAGLFIDQIVPAAVRDFHRQATMTVVRVDHGSLERIRQEALVTQEALIVEEQGGQSEKAVETAAVETAAVETAFTAVQSPVSSAPPPLNAAAALVSVGQQAGLFVNSTDADPSASADGWDGLGDALDDIEKNTLSLLLFDQDIKTFADECGIMLEVLVDGINEKAMDCVGDNLIDEEFCLYDEYRSNVAGLM